MTKFTSFLFSKPKQSIILNEDLKHSGDVRLKEDNKSGHKFLLYSDRGLNNISLDENGVKNLSNSTVPVQDFKVDYSHSGSIKIVEQFTGIIPKFDIKYPRELGEEHPFNFELTEGLYKKYGLVTGTVDKYTDFIVGRGYYFVSTPALSFT